MQVQARDLSNGLGFRQAKGKRQQINSALSNANGEFLVKELSVVNPLILGNTGVFIHVRQGERRRVLRGEMMQRVGIHIKLTQHVERILITRMAVMMIV